jgi:hypothetical protein
MFAFFSGAFFTDKVRGVITMFLLVLLVGLWGAQYFWPRHANTLDDQTIDALKDVRGQLERVANNLDKSSEAQTALNQTLARQLDSAKQVRDEGYAKLFKEYGLDLGVAPVDPNDPFGLRAPDHDLGGQPVPPSSGSAGADQYLQESAPSNQGKTNPSGAGGSKPKPGATSGATGGSNGVPDPERLHVVSRGS